MTKDKDGALRYKGIEFFKASGWQRSDDEHSTEEGVLGYRVVFKTLKLIPFPPIQLKWPNLIINLTVESVEYGGMNIGGEPIESIFPDRVILPEYLELIKDGDAVAYSGKVNMEYRFQAYQENYPLSGVVEILFETKATEKDEIILEGRRNTAPFLTILDFVYGERLLGARLAEEIITLFPDGHWNRKIHSPSVGSESQLEFKKTEQSQFELLEKSVNHFIASDITERKKAIVATDWFWRSEREPNPVNRFIQLWICVEALEMEGTKIKPVINKLASITQKEVDIWKTAVGRLFGKRSTLVHGNDFQISETEILILRGIVTILLSERFGQTTSQDNLKELLEMIKSTYP